MGPAEQRRIVRLVGVPVATALASQAHLAGVLHEGLIADVGEDADATARPLPDALAQAIQVLRLIHAAALNEFLAALRAGAGRGEVTVDFEAVLPVSAAGAAEHYLSLIEQLDEWCRGGAMLHPPASGEVRAFRRWMTEQIVGQLREGAAPAAFAAART